MFTSQMRSISGRFLSFDSAHTKFANSNTAGEILSRSEVRGRCQYVGLFLHKSGNGADDYNLLRLHDF